MNKKGTIFVVILTLVVLGFGVYLYMNRPNVSRWDEHLNNKLKEPYGLHFAEAILKSSSPDFTEISVKDDLVEVLNIYGYQKKATYFYMGESYNLTRSECTALMEFVERGNTAFICTRSIPQGNHIDSSEYHSFKLFFDKIEFRNIPYKKGSLHPTLTNTDRKFEFLKYVPFEDEQMQNFWLKIDVDSFDWTSNMKERKVLGETEVGVNYVYMNYGLGDIFIHSNPLLISNYFLKEENGFDYFTNVLKYVPSNPVTLYDNNSRFYKAEEMNGLNRNKEFYPMDVIMENKALSAFVFLVMALVILFVLINSKRRQRTIPLLPDNSNTSIEFSKTIGALYLQSGNNRKLLDKKMKMFRFYLYNKYGIATNNPTEQNLITIAQKSGMAIGFIKSIFEDYKKVKNTDNVTSEELMKFHNSLEIFYNNTNL